MAFAATLPANARVYLFGSRADPAKRGGDATGGQSVHCSQPVSRCPPDPEKIPGQWEPDPRRTIMLPEVRHNLFTGYAVLLLQLSAESHLAMEGSRSTKKLRCWTHVTS